MVRMLDILAEYLKYRQFPFQVRSLVVAEKLGSSQEALILNIKQKTKQIFSLLWGWQSTGTSCPEVMESPSSVTFKSHLGMTLGNLL